MKALGVIVTLSICIIVYLTGPVIYHLNNPEVEDSPIEFLFYAAILSVILAVLFHKWYSKQIKNLGQK
jgi:uncharacterized membrane protein